MHPSEVPLPLSMTPSVSCRSALVRSGRTVRRGGEDRSWFGRPQAIKKAAGNAASKGTNASNVLASQRHHHLQTISSAMNAVYELPKKKERSLPAHLFDACPLTEGNRARVMGRTPTGRRHYDQTTPEVSKPREGRVPCSLPFDASPPFTERGASTCSPRYKPCRHQ